MKWLEVKVTVSTEAVEAVGERLRRMGARGFTIEEGRGAPVLVSYFPLAAVADRREPVVREEALRRDLQDFLARLPEWGLDPGPAGIAFRLTDDTAWRSQWKAYLHAVRLGRRLLVRPPWERPVDARPGDVVVVIDPGQAFGTGHHPTTQGALELLEVALAPGGVEAETGLPEGPREPRATGRDLTVVDLGTGSGVLAIAAARLGAGRVLAVDNDPAAVQAARANVRRNRLATAVRVRQGDAFALLAEHGPGGKAGSVELILANLTTELISALAAPAAEALAEGGVFLCSGVAAGEGERGVLAAARAAGLREVGRRTAGGWTSLLLRKVGAGSPAVRRVSTTPELRSRQPRAVFYTLGCKVNSYDSLEMMASLHRAGWEVLAHGGEEALQSWDAAGTEADLYVVNSCAVTARAEGKSRQLARKLRREHPAALVALVGCFPQLDREEAAAVGVDFVLGTTDRARLADLLAERGYPRPASPGPPPGACEAPPGHPSRGLPRPFAGERTRATLKVQDGCEQFCAYCVVPYARGPSRSRPAADVVAEAERLAQAGFKEVVVTGTHLGAWGVDLARGASLADLVGAVAAVPGLTRVRLSSLEPLEISDDLLGLMATNPKVCRHLHVPLQSGGDGVLARMNRGYTGADYLRVIERIRSAVPLAGITTDVMVGFPGETEDDFGATLALVRRARFSRLHVFRFSPRPGTPAAEMPGQVGAGVKKARSDDLIRLGRHLAREFGGSLVGLTLEVLVETVSAGGGRTGRLGFGFTDNYLRATVRGPGVGPNRVVSVLIEEAAAEGLAGSVVRRTPVRSGPAR